ncbi:hypothetical protein AMS68_005989 [Peltaster fructicola]|uniref:Methyltransferase small domain-containing protein n=1 Tax=Peltaster fructicola TaxID=286661 RepID=A0A6H0Y0B2_9PEZI|nr:hypothetical protein AMS68_005989 [Peltaster fructicola]
MLSSKDWVAKDQPYKVAMLPTPSTSHVSFENIYEPAEDSYLLLDTLSSAAEVDFLTKRFPSASAPPIVLEVGTGSGVVLAFVGQNAARLFGRPDVALLGSDINLLAARASHATATRALSDAHTDRHDRAGLLDIVTADLAGPIKHHEVDVLIFNPPYVPTECVPEAVVIGDTALSSHATFERDSQLLALSYAGGVDGMATTWRLLEAVPTLLSERGVAFILLCAQNKPEQVKEHIRQWPGSWKAETVGTSGKKAGWEKLCIVRVWR